MRLDLIDGMRFLIIALLVYVPTVTISGWFTAWVAKRCDDDLPERFGFLTLDPFAHFSIFGFALLLIGELFGNYLPFLSGVPGFGRFIILDPQPMSGRIKAVFEFFARSSAHFIMLTLSVIVLALFPPLTTPLLISCHDVLIFFYKQNIILSVIYFLFGLADMICFFWNIPRMFSVHYFGVLVATLLLLDWPVRYLFGQYVRMLLFLLGGGLHA